MELRRKLVKGLYENHVDVWTKLRVIRELSEMGCLTHQEWMNLKNWVWLSEGLYD